MTKDLSKICAGKYVFDCRDEYRGFSELRQDQEWHWYCEDRHPL